MRIFSFAVILLFVVFCVFSEEVNILEEKNEYGGRTVERIYNQYEQAIVNTARRIEYFDHRNVLAKMIVTTNDTVAADTGIREQIQYYENGNVEKYEMFFTDVHVRQRGYNRMIEKMAPNDVVDWTFWYNNDMLLDASRGSDNSFQFYNVEFIDDEFLTGYEPNERGDVISTSGRYYRLRSVIRFDTEPVDLESHDFMLMNAFAGTFGLQNFSALYTKKVRVYSQNRSYWLYLQTQLIQFVKGQNATIRYYPISRNGELHLICVGFFDLSD
jgi:hypothetical protein